MAAQNIRTLIATFKDYTTARQAARELENSGVPAGSVHVDSNQKTAGAGSGGGYQTEQKEEGGFAGWWHSLFGSDHDDEERRSYEGAIAKGTAIVRATVAADSVRSAVDILNRYGAVDIDRRSATDTSREDSSLVDDNSPLEVVEEELQVGKRAVRRGGVRIYSHVINQPVEEEVRLHEERVTVERRPVNREISPDDVSRLRDKTIEVIETSEEPVVSKRARVREEVVVAKEATERTETVRDNVRRIEVEVENVGVPNEPAQGVLSGGGTTAAAGTLAGETTANSTLGTDAYTAEYRRHFERDYGPGADFESIRPAYEYGYRCASDPRYRGRTWDDVEGDVRTDYERHYPGSRWENVKNAVHYAWEKVAGRR
jgi:uncharacterized protein (TIGR02271 family)